MKSINLLAGIIAGTTLLCAQIVTPLPAIPAPNTALMQYLGLSDAQMQALQDVQRSGTPPTRPSINRWATSKRRSTI